MEEPRSEVKMETIDEIQMHLINLIVSIQETQATSTQKVQVEIHKIANCNLEPQLFGNTLLLNLLAKKTKGIEPVIDYNKSHIVTFNQYLEILQRKVTKRKQ